MDGLIRQMGYVVVATPQVAASAADLAAINGLRITSQAPDRIELSSNQRSCEVLFVQADRAGFRAVGLEARDAAAVDEIAGRAANAGCDMLNDKPSVARVARAVRFRTPFGPIFEVHTPVPREPVLPQNNPGVRAKRLDHVNLRVNDARGFHDFVTGVLGMRLSDRTENYGRAWYRAGDGFHHTLAAAPGEGIHHYGFDAASLLDLAAVADGLTLKGRVLLWGIGRHGPGNNIFSYYQDINGLVVETSFGMERVDEDAVREAGVWSEAELMKLLDVWGSRPPAHYAKALTPFVS